MFMSLHSRFRPSSLNVCAWDSFDSIFERPVIWNLLPLRSMFFYFDINVTVKHNFIIFRCEFQSKSARLQLVNMNMMRGSPMFYKYIEHSLLSGPCQILYESLRWCCYHSTFSYQSRIIIRQIAKIVRRALRIMPTLAQPKKKWQEDEIK